jgi:hypothetical protein
MVSEFIRDIFVAIATKFLLQDCFHFLHYNLVVHELEVLCYSHGTRLSTSDSIASFIGISA